MSMKMTGKKMKVLQGIVVALGVFAAMGGATQAMAEDWHDRGEHRGWREHREHDEWREHEWREHHRGYYAPGPVYVAPPPVYVAPPAAVYVPPPVYVAPPPTGLNIILPIHIR